MSGASRSRLLTTSEVHVPAAVAYGFAVALSLAMLVIRDALSSVLGPGNVFLQAFPAIVVAAMIGGTGPGLVATLVSAAGLVVYTPLLRWVPLRPDVLPLAAFIAIGAFISVVTGALKSSRRAAVASEQRYRELVELSPVAVLINFNGEIAFTNAAMRTLVGARDARELHGRQPMTLLHPDSRPGAAARMARLQAGGTEEPWQEQRWLRLDGSTVPVEVAATLVPWRNASAIQVLVRDLTTEHDSRARQEALLESAERANRTKDEFLATLSHELRTPLNAVLGWTHILLGSATDARSRRGLEVIKRNSEALQVMVEEILQLSRVVTGQLRLNVGSVALRDVISHSVETIAPTAAARGITVRASLPDDTTYVAGDARRLQQVMWNLLANAVKFTESGGSVQVALQHRDGWATVTVADTGQGIAPAFLPHVFDAFRQEDASGTRVAGGLGLGLALVRRLVEAHGGTVTAHSAGHGHGATFTVVLPQAPPNAINVWEQPRTSETSPLVH